MSVEKEEIKFQELLADKRHKELKSILTNISISVGKDNGLKESFDKYTQSIDELTGEIKNIVSKDLIEDEGHDEVIKKLDLIDKGIKKIQETEQSILEELKVMSLPKEFRIEFTRSNYSELIQSPIIVKSNYMNIKAKA
jgi:gas vesicle protein